MDSKFSTKLDKILHVVSGEETPPSCIFPTPAFDCWDRLKAMEPQKF
jgi:hypothetical protein